MELNLKGKTAVVTGAGQGMGRAIALCLANEGADVVINDIFLEKAEKVAGEMKALGRKSMAVKANVSVEAEVKGMFHKVLQEFGGVDILVNNAGVGDGVEFAQSKREDWDRAIGICLYGALFCTRAVIENMISRKSGKIVSILSDAGRVGEPGLCAYSAAKAGILGFSKALAKEVGKYGITVNCVSPGATQTDHIRERDEEYAKKFGEKALQERKEKILRRYPLRRFGEPEDVARAVAFLCSETAGFITGQALSVNGGYSMVG